jgi:hypothetical protein
MDWSDVGLAGRLASSVDCKVYTLNSLCIACKVYLYVLCTASAHSACATDNARVALALTYYTYLAAGAAANYGTVRTQVYV